MAIKKEMSFNGQVYKYTCNKFKLKRREKIILQRLMGFFLRNDKPFPYSIKSLSEMTGYSRSSVFESLNTLEYLRIINRTGFTNMTKFSKGSIMKRICSLVQISINKLQVKSLTLVQFLDELAPTSPETGYLKTSLSLKHKDMNIFFNKEYQEYKGRIKADISLKLIDRNTEILDYESWIKIKKDIS